MAESPEEVEAEDGHPAEQGEAGEVHRVADDEADVERDGDEELGVAAVGHGRVVGHNHERSRQEDEQ